MIPHSQKKRHFIFQFETEFLFFSQHKCQIQKARAPRSQNLNFRAQTFCAFFFKTHVSVSLRSPSALFLFLSLSLSPIRKGVCECVSVHVHCPARYPCSPPTNITKRDQNTMGAQDSKPVNQPSSLSPKTGRKKHSWRVQKSLHRFTKPDTNGDPIFDSVDTTVKGGTQLQNAEARDEIPLPTPDDGDAGGWWWWCCACILLFLLLVVAAAGACTTQTGDNFSKTHRGKSFPTHTHTLTHTQ